MTKELKKIYSYLCIDRDVQYYSHSRSRPYLNDADLAVVKSKIKDMCDPLYQKAKKVQSQTKNFHIISKFILNSNKNGTLLVKTDLKNKFWSVNSGKPFITPKGGIWSKEMETFFGFLESHVATILKEMNFKENSNYKEFDSYEQRFAICISIILAYFRSALVSYSLKYNHIETIKDQWILEHLYHIATEWLLSGRVWVIDMNSKILEIPSSAGIALEPIKYEYYSNKGKEVKNFYLLPFKKGYIGYSDSSNSLFLDSYVATKFPFGDNRSLFEDELDLFNTNLDFSVKALKEKSKNYLLNDAFLVSDEKKKNILSIIEEITEKTISNRSIISKLIEEIKDTLNDSYTLQNSIFLSVKTGGDTVSINFFENKMQIFRSSFLGESAEQRDYSESFFKEIKKKLEEIFSQNGYFYFEK